MELSAIMCTIAALIATTGAETAWYPKYHIASPGGWMNDPNGLSYHNGYYHVFWQYNPDSTSWGLMHWGHARSIDLLSWEYLPIALEPSLPDDIDGIFSGSAVVKDDKLTLIYTGVSAESTRQRQMVAVSANNNDTSFEKLGVVIVTEDDEANFRDPKAWYQDDAWYVVIGSKTTSTPNRGETLLYKSQNFLNWTFEGVLARADDKLGYMWECPDFFTLNDSQILMVNPQGIEQDGYDYQNLYQTGYFVGKWAPGENYTIEQDFKEIDHGHDFYASQTFLAPDGRRILIGWLDMWDSVFPESENGWAGMLSLPRELTLSPNGKIEVRPIREVKQLRKLKMSKTSVDKESFGITDELHHNELYLEFNLVSTTSSKFGIILGSNLTARNGGALTEEGLSISIDRELSRLVLERNYPQYNVGLTNRSVEIDMSALKLELDLFIDGSSIEVFVNDGQAVLSSRIYPNNDQRYIGIFNVGDGSVTIDKYVMWEL